jgi:hypothetical protein
MRKHASLFLTLVGLFLLTGCAGSASTPVAQTTPPPPKPSPTPTFTPTPSPPTIAYRKRAMHPSAEDRGMHGCSFPEAGRTGWVSTPETCLVLDNARDLMYT